MKKYETLIFDLDDTLIDNKKAIKYAFSTVLKVLELKYNEKLSESWLKFDRAYWHSWETKEMMIPSNNNQRRYSNLLKGKQICKIF